MYFIIIVLLKQLLVIFIGYNKETILADNVISRGEDV